jgi:hypothetical protein
LLGIADARLSQFIRQHPDKLVWLFFEHHFFSGAEA